MSGSLPHYVLFSSAATPSDRQEGRWRIRLQDPDGAARLEAAEVEPRVRGERLELLAVVRGLEALDEPSDVTLVTDSNYVVRGLTDGLDEWRANGWTWEAFGDMVPVKNRDLWQRVDRAMIFHRVDVRRTTRPKADGPVPAPHFRMPAAGTPNAVQPARQSTRETLKKSLLSACFRSLTGLFRRLSTGTLKCAH